MRAWPAKGPPCFWSALPRTMMKPAITTSNRSVTSFYSHLFFQLQCVFNQYFLCHLYPIYFPQSCWESFQFIPRTIPSCISLLLQFQNMHVSYSLSSILFLHPIRVCVFPCMWVILRLEGRNLCSPHHIIVGRMDEQWCNNLANFSIYGQARTPMG